VALTLSRKIYPFGMRELSQNRSGLEVKIFLEEAEVRGRTEYASGEGRGSVAWASDSIDAFLGERRR
jgi:hypothetical protein